MFGLEDQKKKKQQDFLFDLEQDVKNPKRYREIKDLVESRIQKVKSSLKSGEQKQEFDEMGTLLHGYTALLKVMARGMK